MHVFEVFREAKEYHLDYRGGGGSGFGGAGVREPARAGSSCDAGIDTVSDARGECDGGGCAFQRIF